MEDFRFYKSHIYNHTDEKIWINPLDNTTYFSYTELEKKVDNIAILDMEGINGITVDIYPEYWHIRQVGGYNKKEGAFCYVA